ncbi:MAG: leucine-rich repeat protein [Marinilabiliaceae bacterium]|nr:leucine-rich repeat protein [Marinilabiliaceae bacterium]
MNKKTLFLVFFLACMNLHGQVSKTVNITAGGLTSTLTTTEKNTITNLTITGTLDARDFKTMRDSMPVIAVLDMVDASIEAYSGSLGTFGNSFSYPAGGIPHSAFYKNPWKSSLTSVTMPSSITYIGINAFYGCTGLRMVVVPYLVTTIGSSSFERCTSVESITIPASVSLIKSSTAFAYCSGDIIVDENNLYYSSADSVLFDKEKKVLMHCSTKKTGSYVIPSSVETISDYAFAGCRYLTLIAVPLGVTSIGDGAFQCQKLASINLPPNITSIGDALFSSCHKLTSIEIPPQVTSIGRYAFSTCTSLTSIKIPSAVTEIGSYAFTSCTALSSIYVDFPAPVDLSTVTNVFDGINKSTCKLYVPYMTKDIYADAVQWEDFTNIVNRPGFYLPDTRGDLLWENGSIDSVSILSDVSWVLSSDQTWLDVLPSSSNGNKTIHFTASANPDYTNRMATVTVSAIDVPSQTIDVIQYGIPKTYNVSAGELTNALTIEEKNTVSNMKLIGTIDARDFKTMRDSMPVLSNIDLSEVSIVEYTGTLGTSGDNNTLYPTNIVPSYAFCVPVSLNGKSSIYSIVFPATVTSIGSYAFYGCTGIPKITLTSQIAAIEEYSFYGCTGLKTINFPASVTTIGNYAFKGCSDLVTITNNSSLTAIGSYAFSDCVSIKDFFFPSTLKTIGSYAFNNCSNLSSVSIPSQVTTIGYGAFKGCFHLKTATISSAITSIGNYLFYGCSDLTDFTIPSTITKIGYYAFAYCSSLKSIAIPTSVKTIDNGAFEYCSSLISVEIPSSVTFLGASAFSDCSSLTTATLPSSITTISEFLFSNCNKLDSLVIPSSVKTIMRHALQNCNFTKIEVPSSVNTIGDYAFSGNSKLTSVYIPSSVTSMGIQVFSWCTSLPTVKIPKSITRMENSFFSWCTQLTSFTIPSSITHIGYYAFYNCSRLVYLKSDNEIPVSLVNSSNVFQGVNKTTCKLYVPYGSSGLYAAANQWSDFLSIIEIPGFMLFENQVSVDSAAGSMASVDMLAYTPWTASSDQSWLTIDQSSGDNDCTLTFTATSNPFAVSRVATVTISAEGFSSQTITITQEPGAGSSIFNNLAIADMTITESESQCFNAYDTITVAGGETTVLCENGSSVNFIAGRSIQFLPGFHAAEGSSVQAYITTDNSFCDNVFSAIVYQPEQKSERIEIEEPVEQIDLQEKSIKVYPNPNNGQFSVILNNFSERAEVTVYSLMGKKVFQTSPARPENFDIDLSSALKGLYIVKVISGGEQFMKKIIVN